MIHAPKDVLELRVRCARLGRWLPAFQRHPLSDLDEMFSWRVLTPPEYDRRAEFAPGHAKTPDVTDIFVS